MRTSLIKPYLKIWGEDTLELLAEATVWDDLRAPASSAGPGSTNPTFTKFRDNGAGSVGVYAQRFDDPGASDDLMFDMQLPHSMMEGSTLHPHIHWSPNDASAGNVGWGIEYTEANIGEAFPLTTIEQLAFAAGGVQYGHQLSEFTPIAKPTRSLSAMLKVRIFRHNTAGVDTYVGYAWLHEFDLHFIVDTMGSRQEYIK